MIPRNLIPKIAAAITEAVNEYGHPDEIPCSIKGHQVGALEERGIPIEVAISCEALLTSEGFPDDTGAAVAKWLRLIGEYALI